MCITMKQSGMNGGMMTPLAHLDGPVWVDAHALEWALCCRREVQAGQVSRFELDLLGARRHRCGGGGDGYRDGAGHRYAAHPGRNHVVCILNLHPIPCSP